MSIDWKWFKEHIKEIILVLIVIIIIGKIDVWINGTDKSFFLKVLKPFTNSLILDLIILGIILLIGIYYQLKEQ